MANADKLAVNDEISKMHGLTHRSTNQTMLCRRSYIAVQYQLRLLLVSTPRLDHFRHRLLSTTTPFLLLTLIYSPSKLCRHGSSAPDHYCSQIGTQPIEYDQCYWLIHQRSVYVPRNTSCFPKPDARRNG